jgi:hypothetical protein
MNMNQFMLRPHAAALVRTYHARRESCSGKKTLVRSVRIGCPTILRGRLTTPLASNSIIMGESKKGLKL